MKRTLLVPVLTFALLGLLAAEALATARSWTGTVDYDWFVAGNWNPVGAPDPSDDLSVLIGTPGTTTDVWIAAGGGVHLAGVATSVSLARLYPGRIGIGHMWVESGANVSTSVTHIGYSAGSDGVVTVSDVLTSWTNSGAWYVGEEGTGTFYLSGGATVSSGHADIARQVGSVGTVTIEDTGSTWTVAGAMCVGGTPSAAGGAGTLTVDDDGEVDVGGQLKVWNTGTVELYGSEINTGSFTVESGGTFTHTGGMLTVDGGTFDPGTAGHTIDGTDNPTLKLINGAGASFTDVVAVGNVDDGTLTLESGATFSGTTFRIGSEAGSNGQVSLDGSGSSLTGSVRVNVGRYGNGTLAVSNGAAVSSSYGYIGCWSGSTGSVSVSGAGSTWTITDDLCVGGGDSAAGGTGVLTVENGGEVSVESTLKVWASGTVELLGSQINTGSFTVESGGTFTHTGGTLTVDSGTFDPGTAGHTIDGTGNPTLKLINGAGAGFTDVVAVGDVDDGTLILESGATVVSSTELHIGRQAGSNGYVTLDGSGSSLTSSSFIDVGDYGNGTLAVTNGATVNSDHGCIGCLSGSTGSVSVSGAGSTWTDSSSLYVGLYGSGALTISNGGHVANTDGVIGREAGSTGTVTVDNGTWTNSGGGGGVYVGVFGNGELSISNGGQVASNIGEIGVYAGGTGAVLVTGAGSTWTNSSSFLVGGSYLGAGGTGILTVANDGEVEAGNTLKVWGPGTVNLTGGTLAADTIDHTAGGAFNFTGGTLHVGTFQGNLTNAGGTLAPGSSPGTAVVTGDYTQQAGGALEIEIVGTAPGQWDVLDVTGAASLGGTLAISLIDSFEPAAGDEFEIMTYASRTGEFADTTGWLFDGNKALVKVYGANALTLFATYQGDANLDYCVDGLDYVAWSNNYLTGNTWQEGDFNDDLAADGLDYVVWSNNYLQGCPLAPGAVPEPASVALLALGGLALLRRRRRPERPIDK